VSEDEAPKRPAPTKGGDDELLADPPMGPPPGGIQGYAAGRRLRMWIAAVVIGVLAIIAWQIKRLKDEAAEQARAPKVPSYTLPTEPAVDDGDRPRKLIWNDGPARLGLSSAEPGVEEIVLPDRRLRLAPGHDVAQVKLEVKGGKTIALKIIAGDVVQLPPEGSHEAPPAIAP
jgi:hypothetical protein